MARHFSLGRSRCHPGAARWGPRHCRSLPRSARGISKLPPTECWAPTRCSTPALTAATGYTLGINYYGTVYNLAGYNVSAYGLFHFTTQ